MSVNFCGEEILGYKRNNENEVEVVECLHCDAVYYAIVECIKETNDTDICDF